MFMYVGVITLKSHLAISCSVLLIATWSLTSRTSFTWSTSCSPVVRRRSAGLNYAKTLTVVIRNKSINISVFPLEFHTANCYNNWL